MVENALRHLTDKRRTSERTGKVGPLPPPDSDLEPPPAPPLIGGPSPPSGAPPLGESLTGRNSKNQNVEAILSSLGKVTAKGTAPVLLPHPGTHKKYTNYNLNIFCNIPLNTKGGITNNLTLGLV